MVSLTNMIVGMCLEEPIDIANDPTYDSKKFSGLIKKNKYGTMLIFKSGKINVTGVKSIFCGDMHCNWRQITDLSANKWRTHTSVSVLTGMNTSV